jgi:hypothetical protein
MWDACFTKGICSDEHFSRTHNREVIQTGTFEGTVAEPTYFFDCTFEEEVDVENCILVDCKGINKIRNLINVQVYNFKEPEPDVYVFESEKMALGIPIYDLEKQYRKEHNLL